MGFFGEKKIIVLLIGMLRDLFKVRKLVSENAPLTLIPFDISANESSTSTDSAFDRNESSTHSHDKVRKQNPRSLRRTMSVSLLFIS